MSGWKEGLAATPLASISAVVLDTETTGLNVDSDRVIQFGAVRLIGSTLDENNFFDQLVDPQVPIPQASTKIHHIRDKDVAGKPKFETVFHSYRQWAQNDILLGFSIGFDLAILKNECQRNCIDWTIPRSLDVRHLVQILPVTLPDYGMETIVDWLQVPMSGRHNALGDAVTTAKLFKQLVPKLAEHGIFTLKQAEKACMGLSTQLANETRNGWHDLDHASRFSIRDVSEYARIDSFPFRHTVGELMKSPPIVVPETTTISDVLSLMMDSQISSVFVANDRQVENMGIITERDILRAISNNPSKALKTTSQSLANHPLISIAQDEFAYKAISKMSAKGIRHLGIHNDRGEICGALSARDLLKQRSLDAYVIDDEIEESTTPESLGEVWTHLASVTRGLAAEKVDSRNIAAIISRELRALTNKACVVAEQEMLEAGRGAPPQKYCMIVLGSGGRGESLLAMDQDNAIIFEKGEPGGTADQWFEQLGIRVADILNSVGVPYCNGGIMASNADWRMDMDGWRDKIEKWLTRSNTEDILNSDIFFDCRSVHGDANLLSTIREQAIVAAANSDNFINMLSSNAANFDSPINWRGKIKTKDGRVDLKLGGLMPLFSTARVLALRHSIDARATPDRLLAAKDELTSGAHLIEDLVEAHRILLDSILKQQLRDIDAGLVLSNRVNPSKLSKYDVDILTWALAQCRSLPDLLGVPAIG